MKILKNNAMPQSVNGFRMFYFFVFLNYSEVCLYFLFRKFSSLRKPFYDW